MFPLDSSLSITLHLAGGKVTRAGIGSSRPVMASARLAGKPPALVLPLLPTLYALCGTAQGLVGLQAVENAGGLSAPPAQHSARRLLARIELLAEHAAGIVRDWPALLGEAPDIAALKPLRPLVKEAIRALYPKGDWLVPGGGTLAPNRAALANILLRLRGVVPAFPNDPAGFQAWMAEGKSVAARLPQRIVAEGLADFGRTDTPLMPAGGPPDLDRRLAADADGSYRTAPDCDGAVTETGPLSRQCRAPLVSILMAEFGTGVLPRLVARLVEMASALREVEDLVQDLTDDPGAPAPLGDGAGLGLVDAARGLLAHRVEVEGGVLRDYRMLAPTEWNFHAAGPLARGLEGVPAEGAEARAALLAASLDPCVPYRIEARHA